MLFIYRFSDSEPLMQYMLSFMVRSFSTGHVGRLHPLISLMQRKLLPIRQNISSWSFFEHSV
jgi:hypothetical protein